MKNKQREKNTKTKTKKDHGKTPHDNATGGTKTKTKKQERNGTEQNEKQILKIK